MINVHFHWQENIVTFQDKNKHIYLQNVFAFSLVLDLDANRHYFTKTVARPFFCLLMIFIYTKGDFLRLFIKRTADAAVSRWLVQLLSSYFILGTEIFMLVHC
jgi:hypothetical protein